MPKPLLILNAGSSSLKFAVFEDDRSLTRIVWGAVDRIGSGRSTLQWKRCDEQEARQVPISGTDHVAALEEVFARLLNESAPSGFGAVGHRVVHGGAKYHEPRKVDTTMLEELRPIRDFDPEHLPVEIALMEELSAKFPETLQVACFDTAFHHQMPRVAQLLPIPRRFEAKGVRRYGFHGISYEYLLLELERLGGSKAAHGRVIFAHLGNGASMAAVLDGKCMDTSMAFTPAAGLLMSTRSGDIDPGLISFLMKHEHMTVPEFDRMINHESGLFGVSETGSDMRDLIEREKTDLRAKEAVALFCYQAKKFIGAYAAVLGGLDTLVFAGGIGENSAPVRERICEGLQFLGVEIDKSRNGAHNGVISKDTSRVTVRVIATDEESMIAKSVRRMMGAAGRE